MMEMYTRSSTAILVYRGNATCGQQQGGERKGGENTTGQTNTNCKALQAVTMEVSVLHSPRTALAASMKRASFRALHKCLFLKVNWEDTYIGLIKVLVCVIGPLIKCLFKTMPLDGLLRLLHCLCYSKFTWSRML